jgi:DNA uptake protein ComE-like DNA-binding protein
MMVVMDVMTVALHLLFNVSGNTGRCQMFRLRLRRVRRRMNAMRVYLRRTAVSLLWCACALAQQQTTPQKAAASPQMRVDINHAPLEELLKVPGMTRSWAGRIVRFRPYRTKQDLLDHGVVTSEVYDRIKDFIIAHHDKE